MSKLYFTSPFIFFVKHPQYNLIDTLRLEYYSEISEDALLILYEFLNGLTLHDALAKGFSQELLDYAVDISFILEENSPELKSGFVWEDHSWKHALYLLLSQYNIKYIEPVNSTSTISDLIKFRRNYIENLGGSESYPGLTFANAFKIPLSNSIKISDKKYHLNLLNRKSVRKFTQKKINFDVFSSILFHSTINFRIAEEPKLNSSDPFLIIQNSFYSWLKIYVAIQGVDNVEQGVYQYNPLEHCLIFISNYAKNADIIATIQNQYWINGGGFCTFIVADWHRYMWIYRHSRAYLNLLIQAGEYGQELIGISNYFELAGWLTPAISEEKASNFLSLQDTEDALLFVKIGCENLD